MDSDIKIMLALKYNCETIASRSNGAHDKGGMKNGNYGRISGDALKYAICKIKAKCKQSRASV